MTERAEVCVAGMHPPPRYLEDLLALFLLKFLHPHIEIKYMNLQKVSESDTKDKEVILVDVGISYDPNLNNYDHHYDQSLPCSLLLVIKHFFPSIKENPVLKAIDVIGRLGFQEVVKQGLVKEDEDEVIFNHNTGFIRVLSVNSRDFVMEFKAELLP